MATFTGLAAIANVIQAIYNSIAFFIAQASQIQALVNAVKNSIGNIAAGQVGAATNYIESALAISLSVAINFLARQVGLGNVGQKVRQIIQRVRVRVDAAVNKLIEYVAQQGNSWLAKAGRGRSNNQQPMPNNRPKPQPTTQNRPGQNNRQPAPNQRPKQQPATQNRPGQNNRQPAPNQRPKQQPATQNRPGQNNRQPAPNQRPKPQPATQNRPGQNNQKPTPKLTPAEIRQHEQMANEAVRQLENTNGRLKDYNTTRAEKIAQARTMKPNYDRRLKSPIKFNVHFESNIAKDKADNDLDFKVVIAPNTTTQTGSVPTKEEPLPPTKVTHIPQGNKAGFVKAEPLTRRKGDIEGSRATTDNIPGWQHVIDIDFGPIGNNRNGPVNWVKMHLLSQKLHGPGEPWNLVPGTKTDNKKMEQGPEKHAKKCIDSAQVLYYEVRVTYHTGEIVEDFPATIEVKWGSMKKQGEFWVRDKEMSPMSPWRIELQKPPLDKATALVVNLSTEGRDNMIKMLNIKERLARSIWDERSTPLGPFKNEEDFITRMQVRYGKVDFLKKYYLPVIKPLIDRGEATFS